MGGCAVFVKGLIQKIVESSPEREIPHFMNEFIYPFTKGRGRKKRKRPSFFFVRNNTFISLKGKVERPIGLPSAEGYILA